MNFDSAFALSIIPDILRGCIVNVYVSLASGALAIVGGFLLALGKRRKRGIIRHLSAGTVGTLRLTPYLVQLYFLFYVLPAYNIVLSATTVGILSLAIHFSCFIAEVFGAGIDSIPKGQTEAAQLLGFSRFQIAIYIIAPQMMRVVAAPTAGYLMTLFKTTPYLAIIGVPELLGNAFEHASNTFRYVEPMLVAGALFLGFCLLIGLAVRQLELVLGESVKR